MPDNLQEIIDRVKAKNHSPEDIQAIESAIQSGNLVLVDGSGAVGLGGNVVDSSGSNLKRDTYLLQNNNKTKRKPSQLMTRAGIVILII
jgi:hypothetical protein